MLYLSFDTNLFRKAELDTLDDYRLSSLSEKIICLINKNKIKDTVFCITQTASEEYLKQIGKWYKQEIVQPFEKITDIIKSQYPVTKFQFRNEADFLDEYSNAFYKELQEKNISIVKTVPDVQSGGIIMIDLFDKTINQEAPFDKSNNRNLKDAMVSESLNSDAKRNTENSYLLLTTNYKDFENNKTIKNFEISQISNSDKDKLLTILNIINKNGYTVDRDILNKEFLYCKKVKEDITNFFEEKINCADYYINTPTIKKINDKYKLSYEEDENEFIVKFKVLDDDVEFECGIAYDIYTIFNNNLKNKIKRKYITYLVDENIIVIEI